jgi:hypothetical protein
MNAVKPTRAARLPALVATLIAIPAALLCASSPAAHAASSFTVYNETQGDLPHWALEQFGLTDNAVVYDQWGLSCSTTGCSNVPSPSTFESAVRSAVSKFGAAPGVPVALDLENIVPVDAGSSAQAQ